MCLIEVEQSLVEDCEIFCLKQLLLRRQQRGMGVEKVERVDQSERKLLVDQLVGQRRARKFLSAALILCLGVLCIDVYTLDCLRQRCHGLLIVEVGVELGNPCFSNRRLVLFLVEDRHTDSHRNLLVEAVFQLRAEISAARCV